MKNKKYILFDLDGTIINSELGISTCIKYALDTFNKQLDDSEINKFIGPPLRDSFMNYCGMSEEQAQAAISKYRELYSVKGVALNRLYNGVEGLLKALCENGKHLFIATSKPEIFAKDILQKLNANKYFKGIYGASLDGSIENKADVIKLALSSNNIYNLSDVVMIGDRKYDIIGAASVGVDSIGVTYGFGSYEELMKAGATKIATTADEVLKILI